MSFHVNIDAGINFLRFIRALTNNTRGPPNAATRMAVDVIMERIRFACENIARRSIQEQHSDGPPLSKKWVKEKDFTWVTGKVQAPPYATSADNVNVWSGFIDRYLTSWISASGTIRGGNEVRVGYNSNPVHPESGIKLAYLLSIIHFGSPVKHIPARPFLNSAWARRNYISETRRVLGEALRNMIMTGAP